ncbi:MAG TPA: hypothetical protein VL096_17030, partial [Pirellulaceae bacterium]|nr:hypothetical protein [Pirellulaceae bacterium]
MNRSSWWVLSLALLVLVSRAGAEDNSAVERRLAESAKILASDEFEGRGIGTEGLNKAADYLAKEFASLGLKTELYNGTPFQKFMLSTHSELGPKEQNRLKLVGPPVEGGSEPRAWDLTIGKDFNPLAAGGTNRFDAPVVFVGYGITAKLSAHGEEFVYDDYAGLNVKDKVVIIIRKEPEQDNPHSIFNGKDPSPHALFNRKIANANEHGAAAIIFVNDSHELMQKQVAEEKAFSEWIDKLTKVESEFKKEATPSPEVVAKYRSEVIKIAEQIQQVGKRIEGDADQILDFNGAGPESTHRKLPILFCSRAKIDLILKAAIDK